MNALPRWGARVPSLLIVVVALLAATLTLGSVTAQAAPGDFTMECSVTPDLTPASVIDAGLQGVVAGESMTFANRIVLDPGLVYQDILARPDGSTYYASYLELIQLPSNLILDPVSVQVTIDDVPLTVLNQATPDPTQFVLAESTVGLSTTWQLLFPGDEAQMLADQSGNGVPSYDVVGAAETFSLEFRAQVPAGSPAYQVEDGAECFTSLSTGPSNRDTDRPRIAVSTVAPELLVEKTTALDNAYVPGAVAEFAITASVPVVDTATLTHAVASAQNVVLVDSPDVGIDPSDADGVLIADDGTTAGGGVWDADARTITYMVGTILPDANWTTDELFVVDPASAPALRYENVVCGSYTALADPSPTVDAGCATAEVIVASLAPAVQKRALRIPDGADLERYGVELPFWYEVTVSLPAESNYDNFTILDTLPDGLVFNSYVSAECTPVGPTCPTPVAELTPTVFGAGEGTAIGWYPNSFPYDASPRTITVRYEAQLSAAYPSGVPLAYFDEFVNDLSINWNTVDRLGAVAPATAAPPSFDGVAATSDTLVYDRPLLTIDKSVLTSDGVAADESRVQWDYEIGDIATYTIVVTNQGSSDAYDATVLDVPVGLSIDLASVLVDGNPCAACALVGAGGTDLEITLAGPIAPGAAAAVTITYEAEPTQNGNLDNTSSVPTYGDEFDTPYLENPQDTVALEIPDPLLTLDKARTDDTREAANTLGTRFPFVFTVRNVTATTAYTPIITDAPPAGMCNFDGGLDASAAGLVTETAAGVWALDAPLAPSAVVSFTAWIEVCGPVDPGTYTNNATLTWTDLVDGTDEAGTAYVATSDEPVVLVGPSFTVDKSPAIDAGAVTLWSVDTDAIPPDPAGLDLDELVGGNWTIVVTNTGTEPIGGLNVVDVMPDPFEYLVGSATVDWFPLAAADTFTENSVAAGSGAIWESDGYTTTADFTIGQLAPGAEIRIRVPFVHNGESPADGQLTRLNTVEVRNDNLEFDPELHSAQGEYTLIPIEAGPSISKTVSPASVAPGIGTESTPGQPGQQFDFAIEVTIPTKPTTQTHDVWVLDELPDGMFLVNEPTVNTIPSAAADGWTVSCTSADCDATVGGEYLGSQAGVDGKTELAWFFGDTPIDPDEEDRVYLVTFRAEIAPGFADGEQVVDGVNEPLINVAKPIFNRDVGLPGGTGPDGLGVPNTVPDPADYERVYPLDPAEVDVVTPRIDLDKTVAKDGVEVQEITAGDNFVYTVTATNGGSGDAFDIDINDTLGTPSLWTGENFMAWDIGSLTVDPAGVTCSVYQPFAPDPVEHMLCEFAGPLAPGESITITLDATTVPNDEFFAQTSPLNFDPMIIRNEASTPEYWEAAGEGGNSYSTGAATTRVFAFTPVPEIDADCTATLVDAPAGSDVQFYAVIGNGDRYDEGGNGDGDKTLTPFPTEDLDGDGFPDAGIAYNPEVRITLQDSFIFLGVQGTGPGAGDPTYLNYTPFADPDEIVTPGDEGVGTYTLVWNTSLDDIPHSPNHDTMASFEPYYDLLIDVTKTTAGGGTIWFDMTAEDAAGNTDRGTSVGEPFEFREKDRQGCPGGPTTRVDKFPDVEDGVTLNAGSIDEFVIYITQPFDDPVPSTFTDLLPAGLVYRGNLDPADDDFAVATMDTLPAGWNALDTYLTSSAVDGSGNTIIEWSPPDLPTGTWTVRVPVKALADPLFPNEYVVNNFQWNADGTIRQDSGAMRTNSTGQPSLVKRVADDTALYGGEFEYTIEVTIPGGYAGTDVFIYDEINRWNNWDAGPYDLQDGGNYAPQIFPTESVLPWPPAVAGEFHYENWSYTPAEMELIDYTYESCESGCTDAATAINIVPLPPDPLDTAGTLPVSTGNPEAVDYNGAIGWYLGDIAPAPTDRIIELRYLVQAPTLEQQRQRVVDLNPTNFPGGASDPLFDARDSRWFEELSHVQHPNRVTLRDFANPNAVLGAFEGGGAEDWRTGTNAWIFQVTSTTELAVDDEMVSVAYPLIDMDKRCGAVGASTDETVTSRPIGNDNDGIPNTECTVTLTNQSPVEAFNVNVVDAPLDECVMTAITRWGERTFIGDLTSSNPWHEYRHGSGTGFRFPDDPGVVTYPCERATLIPVPSTGTATAAAGTFPLEWDLSVAGNATETLTYQFYVDGWTNQPAVPGLAWNNGDWDPLGEFVNNATLDQWTASPTSTDLIGEPVTDWAVVGFEHSVIDVQKFPYPEGRNICTGDASPFINWNKAPEAALTNLTVWHAHPAGDLYDPANAGHVAGYGDPLNSEYWTQGEDYCADPLQPPDREVYQYYVPWQLRGIPLGTYGWDINYNGWVNFGDPFDSPTYAGGEGWFDRPLDDPSVWSDQFYATPTEPYRWAIDIRVDGLQQITDIDITDTLPVGWEYVPGSATIVDGVWTLGTNPAPDAFDTGNGFETGYGEVALPDPATTNAPDGSPACHADSNYHSGGQSMTWNFERDGGADGDAPWLYQYLDRREHSSGIWFAPDSLTRYGFANGTTGHTSKASWVRIHYYATPLIEVFDCDPDTTSSDPFMMENNVTLDARLGGRIDGQAAVLSSSYDTLVPVTNPVNFEKLPDDDYVADETTALFTIEFENNLAEPVLDLTIVDELRASIPPIAGGGYICGTATATLDGVALALNETQCDNPLTQATDLAWLIAQVAPDQVLVITIPVVVPKDETNLLRWDNTAATVVKEFYDSSFSDAGRISVVNPSPAPLPVKVVTPNPATVNDTVTYEVSMTANALQVFMDLAYIDTVPDGLTFLDHVGVACTGGCPSGFTADDVVTITPQVNADGTTTLMWWFGDMPGSNQAHTWTMTYTAVVDETYNDGIAPVLDEDVLINIVTGYASHENLLAEPVGLLDPTAWALSEHPPSGPVQGVLDIEEPELAITKTATPLSTPVDGSAEIEFTVVVQNVGGMSAYNVEVTDTPNVVLENIVLDVPTHPNAVITQGWTEIAPELSWFITELAQGETAAFTYTAEVVDTFLVDGFWVAENLASIDEFWARPGSEPEPGDRVYVGEEASAAVPLVAPEMQIEKTIDCVDEFAFVEVEQPVEWCLVITNLGESVAYNVTVADELPYNWTYDAGSTTATGWTATEPSLVSAGGTDTVEWALGDLAAGAVVELRFDATPQVGAPEVITNWASVEMTDASGADLPSRITQARDRNPASASIGRYGLEIAKTPDRQEWGFIPAGGLVEWDLTISNPAVDTTNTNLVVTDFLPAPLTYGSSSSTDSRVSAAVVGPVGAGPGGTTALTWTISDLAAGESVVIELDANATGSEVPLQWHVNDVQVTSDQIADLVANQAKVRFFEPASVGDFVFADTDVDGIQGAGESGVNGVIVTLLDGNGDPLYRNPTTGVVLTSSEWAALTPAEQADAPIMQVTTANDPDTGDPGWYEFDQLPAGSYQIEFDPSPTGLFPTLDDQGADDGEDSDANRFTGLSHVFTLVPGQHDPTIDMGLITPEQYDDSLAGIDIEKWTNGVQADVEPGPSLVPGDPVTWTYQVTNTGWTTLADIAVVDSVEGEAICDVDGDGTWDGTNLIPILLPGEIRNCYIVGTVGLDGAGEGTGQYVNSADTSGTPVLPDFATCGCDPDDPAGWPTDPAANMPALDTSGDPLVDVADDDPSHYFSASPSVDIEKATNGEDADIRNGPVVVEGDTVTWTYVVSNTGNTALDNVTVVDDQGVTVICDVDGNGVFDDATGPAIGLMLPGDTVTCQGTGVAAVGPYRNVGDVTGDPVLPDPLTCGCTIDDPTSWPDDPTVFTPTVDPTGDPLDPVIDDDPSHHLGAEPSIDIEKDTNGVQSDDPPGEPIDADAGVTWTYVVTNTGTTALLDATVNDSDPSVVVDCDPSSQVSNVIALLIPGDSATCRATGTASAGAYANTADVTGTPAFPTDQSIDPTNPAAWPSDPDDYTPTGTPNVTDADDSHYFGVEGGLALEKSTNTVDADVEPGVALTPGDPVVWTYEVTNTSTLVMLDVTVTDSDIGAAIDCGDATNVIPILLSGQTITCTSTAPADAVAGQYHNDSDVTGVGSLPADVTAPGVDLGDPTTWPTEPTAYTPFVDEPFVDDDPSNYFALDGGLELEKSTNGFDSDVAPGEQILEDAPVTWTYAVTNNSNATMINVFVHDLDPTINVDCESGSNRIAVLAIGETVTCTATGTAILGAYHNDSNVSGTPAIPDPQNPDGPSDDPNSYVPTGHESTDADPSNYFGSEPAIDIEKDTNGDDADTTVGPVIDVGGVVTWTYVVTNTGNVALTNVTVIDSDPAVTVVCPGGTNVVPLLLPAAFETCQATGIATVGAYENIADVTGTPSQLVDPTADPNTPTGDPTDPANYVPSVLDPVTDDDPSHYVASDGAVMIVKTTNNDDANTTPGVYITEGDPVVWTYTVANTSNTPLIDLVVTDDQGEAVDCGDGTNTIALLLPGATHICTATGVAVDGQYSNLGSVTGTPATPDPNNPDGYIPIPGEDPVTDDDPSHYIGTTPAVEIEKSTNGVDADAAPGEPVLIGDPVTWTFVVTNTGDVPLVDLVVGDDDAAVVVDCGDGTNSIALLVPGQQATCTAQGIADAEGGYRNVGDVIGTPARPIDPTNGCCDPSDPGTWPTDPTEYEPTGQDPVDDDDPSHYDGVPLELDLALQKKLVSSSTSSLPTRHTFSIEVFNQGTVSAIDVMVIDYLPDGMTLNDADWTDHNDGTASIMIPGPIAPGESAMVEISVLVDDWGSYENIAGLEEAVPTHPDSGRVLDLVDIDSELGDTRLDPVVDDELDNEGGDEDDSDIALVAILPPVAAPPVGPGPLPTGFTTPEAPSPPSSSEPAPGPLALTGSNARRLALLGALLVVSGAGFVMIGRRRGDDEPDSAQFMDL